MRFHWPVAWPWDVYLFGVDHIVISRVVMSTTGAPTLDTVLQAIDALYVNPDNSVKENASKWLCTFQRSVS